MKQVSKLFATSLVGFVLLVLVIARMTDEPAPVQIPAEQAQANLAPLQYQAVAQMRINLIRHYESADSTVAEYLTLRDSTVPSVREYQTMLMRIIPEEEGRQRHQLLVSDATLLANSFVNLKNALVTDHVARDINKLNAYAKAVTDAIQRSNELWQTAWSHSQ